MIAVRMARAKDASALAEMNRVFNGPTIAPSAISASLRNAGELVAVALIHGVPAGFLCAQIHDSFCYHAPYAEITEVFVREEFRRMRVATRMIAFMEERLARRRVAHLHILTGVRNRPARALYEGLGYRNNRGRPEVLYEKDMPARPPKRRGSRGDVQGTGATP